MTFLVAVLVLSAIALVSALILYYCSKKFFVKEDPRLGQVTECLPGANCGGCGYPGCGGLASALVKGADEGNLNGLFCPVGGNDVMNKITTLLGVEQSKTESKVAVVRCNGTCENRPRIATYDGLKSCFAQHACSAGETMCGYGCLGCGDCVEACAFNAIVINPETLLAEVKEDKCTACGACVKACPRNIIELRNKGVKNRRVYVACNNKNTGAVAIKSCKSACIGCGRCLKECNFEAITIKDNLCYIDFNACKLCRKCVTACKTHAIVAVNFPEKKEVKEVME